jgi:hypothetical protein
MIFSLAYRSLGSNFVLWVPWALELLQFGGQFLRHYRVQRDRRQCVLLGSNALWTC